MRTLILHVGMGKTGSSYLQAVFAQSASALAERGVLYPDLTRQGAPYDLDMSNGDDENGNGKVFQYAEVDLSIPAGYDTILLSWEGFSSALPHTGPDVDDTEGDPAPSGGLNPRNKRNRLISRRVRAFCNQNGIDRVKLVMLIRNPIGHSVSGLVHRAKARGEAIDVERDLLDEARPQKALRFLQTKFDLPSPELAVFNYDVHKRDLSGVFADILGVPRRIFDVPDMASVNRSLAETELPLILAWNKWLGQSASKLNEAICNTTQAPLSMGFPVPSRAAQEALILSQRPAMQAVNDMIPDSEHYVEDYLDPREEPQDVVLPREYLSQVGAVIGAHLAEQNLKLQIARTNNAILSGRNALLYNNIEAATKRLALAQKELAKLSGMKASGNKLQELQSLFYRLDVDLKWKIKAQEKTGHIEGDRPTD